jgi:hypothetical protein
MCDDVPLPNVDVDGTRATPESYQDYIERIKASAPAVVERIRTTYYGLGMSAVRKSIAKDPESVRFPDHC